jgi:hypothetical protein
MEKSMDVLILLGWHYERCLAIAVRSLRAPRGAA